MTCNRLEIMLLRMSSCNSNLSSACTTKCADKLPQQNLPWHFILPVCCDWISYKGEHLGWMYRTTSCVLRSAWVSAVCGVGWNTPKVAAQTCFNRNSWHGLHHAESYAFIRDDQRITEKCVHSLPINIGNISLWLQFDGSWSHFLDPKQMVISVLQHNVTSSRKKSVEHFSWRVVMVTVFWILGDAYWWFSTCSGNHKYCLLHLNAPETAKCTAW